MFSKGKDILNSPCENVLEKEGRSNLLNTMDINASKRLSINLMERSMMIQKYFRLIELPFSLVILPRQFNFSHGTDKFVAGLLNQSVHMFNSLFG